MSFAIYLVDGTGPADWQEYRKDMDRGFCARLKRLHPTKARYLRGPTIQGLETWAIADIMVGAIEEDLQENPKLKIILGGHSRGGSAAIYAARKLQKKGIGIDGLVLFDAVRRALQKAPADYVARLQAAGSLPELVYHATNVAIEAGIDYFSKQQVDVIPGNVKRALHVIRDERFSYFIQNTPEWKQIVGKSVRSWEPDPVARKTMSYKDDIRYRELCKMHRAMRDACRFDCLHFGVPTGFSFGNTGLSSEGSCQMEPIQKFMATHGAMGGAPLDPESYLERKYAAQVLAQENASMRNIQVQTDRFLAEIGVRAN